MVFCVLFPILTSLNLQSQSKLYWPCTVPSFGNMEGPALKLCTFIGRSKLNKLFACSTLFGFVRGMEKKVWHFKNDAE